MTVASLVPRFIRHAAFFVHESLAGCGSMRGVICSLFW